jgi:hypothetical protein
MAEIKISALPEATTLIPATDVIPVVAGGVTSKVTVADVVKYSDGWVKTVGTFTAAPPSTSTITTNTDLTSLIKVGYPLKYVISGTTYYGIVTAITSGLITIAGPPLGGSITDLYYGPPNKVTQMMVSIPGTYESSSDTALILTKFLMSFVWMKPASYLVKYTMKSLTVDTGTKGRASFRVAGVDVNTSSGGLTLSVSGTTYSTVVDINSSYYGVANGAEIELSVTKGGNGDAANLVANAIFVTP